MRSTSWSTDTCRSQVSQKSIKIEKIKKKKKLKLSLMFCVGKCWLWQFTLPFMIGGKPVHLISLGCARVSLVEVFSEWTGRDWSFKLFPCVSCRLLPLCLHFWHREPHQPIQHQRGFGAPGCAHFHHPEGAAVCGGWGQHQRGECPAARPLD